MTINIYDERALEDILVTGIHNYEEDDESHLRVDGHDLVSIGLDDYDDAIDNPELKKELFEHPERFTLDGNPITEISLHRYSMGTDVNGDEIYQIQVVLFN